MSGLETASTWIQLAGRVGEVTLLERTVNGQPGLVAELDGTGVSVYAFDISDNRITRIRVIRDREKLRPWTTN
ncbi:hypothetical protein [Nocardia acidivorans]|uniref:hypothetical protein n=1 Tax=Nocardia acidivorans TaxID=404580 RepID=UPI00082C6F0C|nr:hypothetical protein [Nocardia acidivorans]